jgi:hypothetical protein
MSPPPLSRRGEELERDVVRVAKRHAGAVGSIHDPTMRDTECVRMVFPLFEFGPLRTREGQMVESRAAFVEGIGAL